MSSMVSTGLISAPTAIVGANLRPESPSLHELNALDFGAKGDGISDDTEPIQILLSKLSRIDGFAKSGSIFFPAGIYRITRPLFYLGSPGATLRLRGEMAGGRAVKDGTCLTWAGTAGASMLILSGANETIIEELNFFAVEGSGVEQCIHVTADNVVNTTLAHAVGVGENVATPAAMKNIAAGMALGIGGEGPEYEIVYVIGVTASTFTARFNRPHKAGAGIGGSHGSSGFRIHHSSMGLPAGPHSCGILLGNATAAETMQVSEVACTDCQFIGSGPPGDSFAGVRVITGGNVKNFRWDNCTFTRSRRGLSIETGSGTFRVMRPIFGNITECDLYQSGPGALFVDGAESESAAPHRFYLNPSPSAMATLIACSWQCAAPEDDCIIVSGGSLTLVGNEFHNHRTKQSVPRVRVNSLSSGTSRSQVTSIGNWYQNASDEDPRFLDGSGNGFGRSFPKTKSIPRFISFGDSGGNGGPYVPLAQSMGDLSISSAGLSTDGCSPGLSVENVGQANSSANTVTIPFTALQAGGSSVDLMVFRMPPRTRIVGAVADTQVPFAGNVTLRIGTTPGGDDLILDHDVGVAGPRGLDDAELGAGVRSASGGRNARTIWSAGGPIYARFKSSGRNLATLDAGRVSIHLIAQHW